MEKIYGTTVRQDGLHKVGRRNFTLFYGLYTDEKGSNYEYRHVFDHKPGWDEVKGILVETINAHTKEQILTGFEWKGHRVWLSDENQRDFMMMEKLPWDVYPMDVKINEDEQGEPMYYQFASSEEFAEFSKLASQYVINTLQAGWAEKDSLNKETFGF